MVRLGDEVFQSYVLPAKPVGACGDVASRVLPRHMGARLHHGHAECLAEGPAREQRQATQDNNRPHATTIPPRPGGRTSVLSLVQLCIRNASWQVCPPI